MKKKSRFSRALLALLTFTCLLSLALPCRAAERSASPYRIAVNRPLNEVTVYAPDETGEYTVPVKAMICSVGRENCETPLGIFMLTNTRKLWCHMFDGSYGQYSCQFSGNYLFHSVCYQKKDPAALLTEEYNMLGSRASRGCVRLQVIDAKWIYENCPAGTVVEIFDSEEHCPLGTPTRTVEAITAETENGWEPTDPRADNPWKEAVTYTLRGRTSVRRAEIYPDASVTVACRVACEQTSAELFVPCGWYLDGEPIAGWQNAAFRIAGVDRYSRITIYGERLTEGAHVLEFRCNTAGLPNVAPRAMRTEILVLPEPDDDKTE